MGFLSTKEASEKWNLSDSRIRRLAANGKIPGAKLLGHSWVIPDSATKPIDGRTKQAKEKISEFKFPLLYLNNYSNEEIQNFSEEEKELYQAQVSCLNCEFVTAKPKLEKISRKNTSIHIRIGALHTLFYASLYSGDYAKANSALASLKLLFETEFEHKKELSLLLEDLLNIFDSSPETDLTLGIDLSFPYSKPTEIFMFLSETYRALSDAIINRKQINPNIYEILCKRLESERYTVPALYMHFYLGFMYQYCNELDKAESHFKRSIDIAIEYKIYCPLLGISIAIFEHLQSVLKYYPNNVQAFFMAQHESMKKHYFDYIEKSGKTSHYEKLTDEDIKFINYVVANLPNKKIGELENLSESTVNKRYLAIYQKLGISGKKKLLEIAVSCITKKR